MSACWPSPGALYHHAAYRPGHLGRRAADGRCRANAVAAAYAAGKQHLGAVQAGDAAQLQGDYPQELTRWSTTLNHVLASNAEMVQRARTQAGNLAHPLNTRCPSSPTPPPKTPAPWAVMAQWPTPAAMSITTWPAPAQARLCGPPASPTRCNPPSASAAAPWPATSGGGLWPERPGRAAAQGEAQDLFVAWATCWTTRSSTTPGRSASPDPSLRRACC